jgi:hypothetical protein
VEAQVNVAGFGCGGILVWGVERELLPALEILDLGRPVRILLRPAFPAEDHFLPKPYIRFGVMPGFGHHFGITFLVH